LLAEGGAGRLVGWPIVCSTQRAELQRDAEPKPLGPAAVASGSVGGVGWGVGDDSGVKEPIPKLIMGRGIQLFL